MVAAHNGKQPDEIIGNIQMARTDLLMVFLDVSENGIRCTNFL
jgi:hypothetical protein